MEENEVYDDPVYLDCNATTPLAPEVKDEILRGLNLWANPSSSYAAGTASKEAINKARESVASMLSAQPAEIVFTSGGTESNHLAIWSAIQHSKKTSGVPHIITTNIEHCAITEPLRRFEEDGLCSVSYIPVVKGTGRVSVSAVLEELKESTCLVTIMLANNETGIIQPVREIFSEIRRMNKGRRQRILLHTDAAQTLGKLRVSVLDLQVDMLTVVGHKFYGPRIGALYCRTSAEFQLHPLFRGGGQESGFRAGTENTPMILGLGAAAHLVHENIDRYSAHMKKIRDYLRDGLLQRFQLVLTEENPELELGQILWRYVDLHMLPNTLSVRFGGTSGAHLLHLTKQHLVASTGAACHSGGTVSQVLLNSWNWEEKGASQTVRLSVGRETTHQDIDRILDALQSAINTLKCNKKDLQ